MQEYTAITETVSNLFDICLLNLLQNKTTKNDSVFILFLEDKFSVQVHSSNMP